MSIYLLLVTATFHRISTGLPGASIGSASSHLIAHGSMRNMAEEQIVTNQALYLELQSKYLKLQDDLREPARVNVPVVTRRQEELAVGRMVGRSAQGRRVKLSLRLFTLCGSRNMLLPGHTIQMDLANVQQAQLAIEALSRFAASLDGIWLAPPASAPGSQAPHSGSKTPGEG